jgi:hypothetical protein
LEWLKTFNTKQTDVDYEEILAFYAEEIVNVEADFEEITPKLLKKTRTRLGIKVGGDQKKNSPKEVPDAKKSVPTNAKKTPASKVGKEPSVAHDYVEATQEVEKPDNLATQEVKKPDDMANLEVKKPVYEAPLEDKIGPEEEVPTDV